MKEAEEVAHLTAALERLNRVHPDLHHIRNRMVKRLEEINAELAEDPPVSTVMVPGQRPEGVAAAETAEQSTTVQTAQASQPAATQTENTAGIATGTPAEPAPEPPLRRI